MEPCTITVPVFPLPNVVFFPNTILPLHIFEPRYKEMVADALAEEGRIGVAQLKPGWETDYYGNPPVYRTLGVGKIVSCHRWEDGRYDIALEGIHRVRILNELRRGDYRTAEVEVVPDTVNPGQQQEIDENGERLGQVFNRLVEALPEPVQGLKPKSWENPTPGLLADVLAHSFIENPYDKQSILGEPDVARRMRLVVVQLKSILNRA